MQNDSEWIDYLQLQESSGGDDEFARELIDMYRSEMEIRKKSIRHEFEGKDLKALSREVHTLKGSSSNVGAKRITEICQAIESLAAQGSLQQIELMLDELDAVIAKTREAFDSHLED